MTNALAHRGPNAHGHFIDKQQNIMLGHRRLSIIDLSEEANQPFYSRDGRYVIVYNGEVYNFRQVREELWKEKSMAFQTHSDTEIIIEAIAHWGIEALQRFNGMFAIGLWDKQEKQLYLIRDRIGIKPLYYYWDGDTFAFASELKGIAALHPLGINTSAIANFLYLGYLPGDQTFYQHCFKLPAGTYGVFSPVKGLDIQPYWSPRSFAGQPKPSFSGFAQAKSQLHDLLRDSVQQRMISDVPLGTFLSGGIDSSTVTAIAQSLSEKRVKTFSIGFKEQRYNEAIHAEKVARHLGTEHYCFMLSKQDALDRVEDLLNIYDEPFADSSAIPTLLLSEMARQEVTVALSGDGGDELFLGYGMYNWAKRLNHPLVKLFRRPLSRALRWSQHNRMRRAATVVDSSNPSRLKSHIFSQEQYLFSEREIENLLIDPSMSAVQIDETYGPLEQKMTAQEAQSLFDFEHYLCEDLLVKVDRASMRYSLEVRVPLLDHRIAAFALALPQRFKIKGGTRKYILKEILYQYVPKDLFDRPKWGFSIPLSQWLKTDLKYLIDNYLSQEMIEDAGLVKYEIVSYLKREYFSGRDYLYNRLWALILLHRWFHEKKRYPVSGVRYPAVV